MSVAVRSADAELSVAVRMSSSPSVSESLLQQRVMNLVHADDVGAVR